jgi:hydroxymethylbilane synthase
VARQKRAEVTPGVLRIATRPSDVALRRARLVQTRLESLGVESTLIECRTTGDKYKDDLVSTVVARTFFTHEIQTALLRKKVDIAVHAMTDLPADASPELVIAAILPRDDPRDALVVNSLHEATNPAELPRGTRIGSSNVRVRALLRAFYRELDVVHLRGDLPTRLQKVDTGQVHATIVPAASLNLIGASQHVAGYLQGPEWLPAPGQGAIGIQCRADDLATREIVSRLDDPRTRRDVHAERTVWTSLEGGLQSPIGALVVDDVLSAVIADVNGTRVLARAAEIGLEDPELLAVRMANELRARGANSMLDEMRRADRIPTPQPD